MKRRRRILILTAVVLTVALAVVFWPREREPEYQGKKLSYWAEVHHQFLHGPVHGYLQGLQARGDGDNKAREAIRQIGTNGLPYFVRCISYEPPRWKAWATWCSTNLPSAVENSRLCRWVTDDPNRLRATRAAFGLVVLEEQASLAIPELKQKQAKARDWQTRLQISYALQMLGVTNLPAVNGYSK